MRKKRKLSWQEKAYGVVVIILIIWMLIYNAVGSSSEDAAQHGAVFSFH